MADRLLDRLPRGQCHRAWLTFAVRDRAKDFVAQLLAAGADSLPVAALKVDKLRNAELNLRLDSGQVEQSQGFAGR